MALTAEQVAEEINALDAEGTAIKARLKAIKNEKKVLTLKYEWMKDHPPPGGLNHIQIRFINGRKGFPNRGNNAYCAYLPFRYVGEGEIMMLSDCWTCPAFNYDYWACRIKRMDVDCVCAFMVIV